MKRTLAIFAISTLLLSACAADDGDDTTSPQGILEVEVVAGPQCPVQQNPPDPECADKPVVGVELAVVNEAGARVTARTGDDGRFIMELPPGTYELIAPQLEEYMGTPGPVTVTVGRNATSEIQLAYDTGIR